MLTPHDACAERLVKRVTSVSGVLINEVQLKTLMRGISDARAQSTSISFCLTLPTL